MNRIRLLAIGTLMMLAVMAGAQQSTASAAKQNQNEVQSPDPVERHLKVLSEKLSLTADQQDQVRPILQEMHDAMAQAEQNQSLSDDERNGQKHAAFIKADGQIRRILSDDQKKTLDQMEQEMHPGMPGKGAAPKE